MQPTQPDLVSDLQSALGHGGDMLFDVVPNAVRTLIKKEVWRQCADQNGRPFPTFEAFVTHKLWWGLESTINDLILYCRKAPDVQAMIKAQVEPAARHGGDGGSFQGYNVTFERGNNPTYTLRRLKRDRPDLAEQVVAGTMSANAAAIEAGFRKKPIKSTNSGDVRLTATARQARAKELVGGGMSQRQAAIELGVTEGTVRNDLLRNNYAPSKKPTHLETAMRAWGKMSEAERDQFLEWATRA